MVSTVARRATARVEGLVACSAARQEVAAAAVVPSGGTAMLGEARAGAEEAAEGAARAAETATERSSMTCARSEPQKPRRPGQITGTPK